jgi:hypothetical protein
MQLSEMGLKEVAEQTVGFSFAYLKELFLSSTMAWAEQMIKGNMDQIMQLQAVKLRSQMESAPAEAAMPEFEEEISTVMEVVTWAQKNQI